MPPTTTLPVVGPGAASKDGKQSSGVATAQKASAAKSATGGSKATDVKSGTNDGKFSFYFKLFSINF